MKSVLVLGCGRSSGALISYLGRLAPEHDWKVIVADVDPAVCRKKAAGLPHVQTRALDVTDREALAQAIGGVDLVISLVPALMHPPVARQCLAARKNLLTASYVSDETQSLGGEVEAAGLLFLCECGLDPGIDHLSGMRVIDQIRSSGGTLTAFETLAGGLLAPSPDVNPWEYKFTWNPRNVVVAGQGGVKFLQRGRLKYIPYHRLFQRTEVIHIPGHGYFEGYGNRDSLKYLKIYGLEGIQTLYRGTLRRLGFCRAWDAFVQLGATDDSYEMEKVGDMNHRDFINSFLSYNPHDSVELKLAQYLGLRLESEEMFRLHWLGVFDAEPVGLERGTPARILEHILKKRWTLDPDDQDMIVMWHKLDYELDGAEHQIQSHMATLGKNAEETAMARTVGLPLGIAARLVLTGELKATGVRRPVTREFYEPILAELEAHGITFVEREVERTGGPVWPHRSDPA
jgi:saccharopine dehydrogenase (NADP+, L-glutamate forming)